MQPSEQQPFLGAIQSAGQPMTGRFTDAGVSLGDMGLALHRGPSHGPGFNRSGESQTVPIRQYSQVAPNDPERRYWWTAVGCSPKPPVTVLFTGATEDLDELMVWGWPSFRPVAPIEDVTAMLLFFGASRASAFSWTFIGRLEQAEVIQPWRTPIAGELVCSCGPDATPAMSPLQPGAEYMAFLRTDGIKPPASRARPSEDGTDTVDAGFAGAAPTLQSRLDAASACLLSTPPQERVLPISGELFRVALAFKTEWMGASRAVPPPPFAPRRATAPLPMVGEEKASAAKASRLKWLKWLKDESAPINAPTGRSDQPTSQQSGGGSGRADGSSRGNRL